MATLGVVPASPSGETFPTKEQKHQAHHPLLHYFPLTGSPHLFPEGYLSELVAVTDSSVSLMGYLMFFWLLEGDGSVDHRSARSASDEHNGCCPHIKVPSTQKNYAKKIFMTQKTTMV
jgi:hypothetical protein